MYPDVSRVAALIGDRARARMLFALLDGREATASELAARGRCSRQSASAHLAALVRGGLLFVRTDGRRRLFRLASDGVAEAIETLAAIAPVAVASSLSEQMASRRLRSARCCYDHLAGSLGVLMTDALVHRHAIASGTDRGSFRLTGSGERFFADVFGADVAGLRAKRRPLARSCMDYTEHRRHLAGSLGAAVFDHFLTAKWVERHPSDRSLLVTAAGHDALASLFGVRLAG